MHAARLRIRWPLAALLILALPTAGRAQARPAPTDGVAPWPAVQAGVRAGYDNGANGTVLGAQIRVPVLRSGWVELMPGADVTFLTGLKEYQFTGDAVVVPGGGTGGLYVAGGVVARNTIYDGPERETRIGGSLALGLMNRGSGDVPLGIQIEVRWVFLDSDFSPQTVTFGVNLPLWGWDRRGAR